MPLREPVSIRFDPETRARLISVSNESGLTPTELVRRATVDYLNQVIVEKRIVIPLVREGPGLYTAKPKKRPSAP